MQCARRLLHRTCMVTQPRQPERFETFQGLRLLFLLLLAMQSHAIPTPLPRRTLSYLLPPPQNVFPIVKSIKSALMNPFQGEYVLAIDSFAVPRLSAQKFFLRRIYSHPPSLLTAGPRRNPLTSICPESVHCSKTRSRERAKKPELDSDLIDTAWL